MLMSKYDAALIV